jgi:hypothetical protein
MRLAAVSSAEVRPRTYGWGCRIVGFQERELVGDGIRV